MNALVNNQFRLRNIIKTQSTRLIMLLSFGFILYACSETQNPVSESTLTESFSLPEASVTGVNTVPVVIQDFTITFNGNIFDSVANTSTFSYTVTRNSNASGFNYMAFEIPDCATEYYAGHTPLESSSVTDDEIRWTSSIGTGSSRNHTVTYNGKKSTGMVNATIQGTGSGEPETKPIPGPCKGIFSISGNVYVDENGNGTRNSGEGGIGNVLVNISNENGAMEDSTSTSPDGSYTIQVYTGGTDTDFTLEVREASNLALFENFTLTQGAGGREVTVGNENVEKINFGFKPDTDGIIQKFEIGDIKLITEKPDFWADESKFADKGKKTLFSSSELIGFLTEIENLDLTYTFQFGDDKLSSAEKILTLRKKSTDLERLLAHLLAAKLNVVSGNGAVDENDVPLKDFNALILKTGAAAAVAQSNIGSSLMMNSTTHETTTFTITASLTSSGNLLTSFNGSGGGLGSGTQ